MRGVSGQAPELAISQSAHGTLRRYFAAVGVVLAWLSLALMDAVLSLMFWTEPNPEILLYTAPMLAVVPWILQMAGARGRVVISLDHIEIRHRRMLKRAIFLDRPQVSRVLLNEDSTEGWAGLETGNVDVSPLWTHPSPRKQHADSPLLGDGVPPNVAIVLARPLSMSMARSSLASLTMSRELPPPRRDGQARVLLLAMEDLAAVRVALADWPTEAVAGGAAPERVAAAARLGREAAVITMLVTATAMLLMIDPALAVVPFFIALLVVLTGARRRRQMADTFASSR